MAAMLSMSVYSHESLKIIDHKYLEPGHTHLKCDTDHARIERAKKDTEVEIRVPQDWYLFVKSVRGKVPMQVVEIKKSDFFLSFSYMLSTSLVKRTVDTEQEKVNWLKIRWMRYEKEFGMVQFKYSLSDEEEFRTINLKRNRRGRPSMVEIPETYSGPVPINPLKKKDLLSLLQFIDPLYHEFYENLTTTTDTVNTGPSNIPTDDEVDEPE